MSSYTERLHLKITVRQLFDLVADVGCYAAFVPWVVAVQSAGTKVSRFGWT
jgi:ribosome-associated toxin RatA of RatAB toxin-antitoxin module